MAADVVDLIKADHREVERLFEELREHRERRPLLVPTLSALLIAHSRAEEAEVYPMARQEAGETEEVAHSQEEHAKVERLLARLSECEPESSRFDELLSELVEMVDHHVEEEESTVLPTMRDRMDGERLTELGRAFARSRAEHLGDRPGHASREELAAQARNMGMSGASTMNKEELARQLEAHASS